MITLILRLGVVCLLTVLSYSQVHAEPESVGTVEFIEGKVEATAPSATPRFLQKNTNIYAGDTVATDASGEVHVEMADGGFIALRPNTIFRIDSYTANGEADDNETFTLLNGAIRSITGWIGKLNPEGYHLQTATATIGIRGTDHETIYIAPDSSGGETPGTYDRVNSGATVLRSEQGEVEIASGQAAHAPHGAHVRPQLLSRVPALFERRRTRHEERVSLYASRVHQHIGERLRRRGFLNRGETLGQFLLRKRPRGASTRGMPHDHGRGEQRIRGNNQSRMRERHARHAHGEVN